MPNNPTEIRYRLATARGALRKRERKSAADSHAESAGWELPRITRLMALAIKLEGVPRQHPELTYQDLARLGHVSASRLTQILNLLHLAPDLQERLLWLQPHRKGRERLHERALRRLSQLYDWRQQRLAFEALLAAVGVPAERQERNAGSHD